MDHLAIVNCQRIACQLSIGFESIGYESIDFHIGLKSCRFEILRTGEWKLEIGGWGLVAGNWWLEAEVARAWLAGGLGLGWWQ